MTRLQFIPRYEYAVSGSSASETYFLKQLTAAEFTHKSGSEWPSSICPGGGGGHFLALHLESR